MEQVELSKTLKQCSQCACFNLRKATRHLTQLYDAALQPTGLRGTQFSLLTNIAAAEGITISTLANEMVMDRTTLTRNLRPLEKSSYIVIGHGSDRRVRTISLTRAGRNILNQALPYWQEAQNSFIKQIGNVRTQRLLFEMKTIEEIEL